MRAVFQECLFTKGTIVELFEGLGQGQSVFLKLWAVAQQVFYCLSASADSTRRTVSHSNQRTVSVRESHSQPQPTHTTSLICCTFHLRMRYVQQPSRQARVLMLPITILSDVSKKEVRNVAGMQMHGLQPDKTSYLLSTLFNFVAWITSKPADIISTCVGPRECLNDSITKRLLSASRLNDAVGALREHKNNGNTSSSDG